MSGSGTAGADRRSRGVCGSQHPRGSRAPGPGDSGRRPRSNPLVGATIGAILVGIVTLFSDFPLDTIIWAGFALGYQQFENYVVQPRIQSRAVDLDPFVVIVAALCGGTLFGILGALVAIPSASALQIAVKEFLRYRGEDQQMPSTSSSAPGPL